jgi:hypothetical protein
VVRSGVEGREDRSINVVRSGAEGREGQGAMGSQDRSRR